MLSFNALINSFKKEGDAPKFSIHNLQGPLQQLLGDHSTLSRQIQGEIDKKLQSILQNENPEECLEKFCHGFHEAFKGLLVDYEPFYKQCNIPEEEVAKFLAEACFRLYTTKEYEYAQGIFGLLIEFDGSNRVYWQGLGEALEASKQYLAAAQVHFVEVVIEPSNPFTWFRTGGCYQQANLGDIAQFFFKKTIEKSADDEEYSIIRSLSELSLKTNDPGNQADNLS